MDRRKAMATLAGSSTLGAWHTARAADGVTDNEVLLGQSAVLSGVLGLTIKTMVAGAQAAFDLVNAGGGVAGRRLRLLSLDDELAPPKAAANYRTLLEEQKVFAMFACVGSGTTAAAAPVLQATDAVMLGGYAVADSARARMGRSAFFVRATTKREAEVLVRQLSTIGITRIAMAHLDNPGGQEALKLLGEVLKAQNLEPVASAAIKGDGSNLGAEARQLATSTPQAVLMYLSGRLPADLMTAMRQAGSHPGFYGMSIVSGEVAAKALGDGARGLAIAQVMPYPWFKGTPDLLPYHRAMDKTGTGINYYSMEGWINAQVLIEALRRTGRDLTRARFAASLAGMKARVAGLDVDFTGGGIAASKFVELVQVRADGSFAR